MSQSDHKSIGERIIRASFAVGAAHILLKVMGLIQARIATQFLSPAVYESAYVVAFEGVIYTLFLIGEESIGPSFLPVFMDRKDKGDEAGAWRFASIVLSLQCLILVPLIVAIMQQPEWVVDLLTDFQAKDEVKRQLAITCVQCLAPSLLGLSLGSTTYMILNGYKRFFLAALGDGIWKIVMVICMVVGIGMLGLSIEALLVGLVAGSVAKLLTHLVGLRGEVQQFRMSLDWRHPAVRSMALLILPLVVGIVLAKVRDVFNNIYVLSALDDGIMQANSVGRKLFQGISWVVPYTVSIAMFPFFCELVDKQDHKRLGELLTQSGRMILAVFIPGCVLMAVLAEPLVILVFKGGKFGMEAAHLAGVSNAIYALVLPAFALEYILMQGFFANRRMVAITVIGIVFSTLSILISWVGIKLLGYTGVMALASVAAAYTISRTLKVMAMIIVLKRSVPMFELRTTALFLTRSAALALAVAVIGHLVLRGFPTLAIDERIIAAGQLAASGTAGAVVFWAGAWILRLHEPFDLLRWAREKVLRRGKKQPTA